MVNFDTPQSRLAVLIVLSILSVPSIACSLYIFYNFIRFRELRRRVHNHAVLLLLIISFLQVTAELPLTLAFLLNSSSAVASDRFCQFWIIFNYTLFTESLWAMAIACIGRYWLVFHRTFFDKHLVLLHYIPMALCIIYPLMLYIYLVTGYSCTNSFNYSHVKCGGACFSRERLLGTFDWVMNVCVDVILSTLATGGIIIHLLVQRRRVTAQRTVWQRSRRIIVQIVSLSILYMIVWIPCLICSLIILFTSVPFFTALSSAYLYYYQYLACLLCPFACLLGSPEIRRVWTNNRVGSTSITHR